MTSDTIISIFLGIGLAASVGFRVFLPLFVLSMATYFEMWQLNESWEWIGSIGALIIFGVATMAEIFAYYIPWFDNLLDAIALPLATVAGTAVMVSTMADMTPAVTWTLAIIAGGGTATAIKGATSATRLTSTATTAGIANPIVSTVETGTSMVVSAAAVFLPVIAVILVIIILTVVFLFYRKIRPRRK